MYKCVNTNFVCFNWNEKRVYCDRNDTSMFSIYECLQGVIHWSPSFSLGLVWSDAASIHGGASQSIWWGLLSSFRFIRSTLNYDGLAYHDRDAVMIAFSTSDHNSEGTDNLSRFANSSYWLWHAMIDWFRS